ncbi:ARMT1-like domain-containing protein [Streptomyces dysideae]|nr:ARMT1-like domain-containing protein [Streptomyces dysideae]
MPDTPPAPVILGNEPGSFPHGVLAERHPAIIRQVREAVPYGPDRRRALDALLASCTKGVIEPLPADAPDGDRWAAGGLDDYAGRSWFDVPWLCAAAAPPADLRTELAAATLTIVKGDLNYRRLMGDRMWPPATPFADVTAYFPGPVAALRTLKSDVITGLDARTEAALVETEGQRWRTGGTHALIQVRE